MMDRKQHWRSLFWRVLVSARGSGIDKTKRTMMTSSPMTSTSGLRKWRSAVIAAKEAQSDRKCKVNLSCQTCM
jgi:hypothetical protein